MDFYRLETRFAQVSDDRSFSEDSHFQSRARSAMKDKTIELFDLPVLGHVSQSEDAFFLREAEVV